MLARPSMNIIPEDFNIIDSLYSLFDKLSKNQKIGVVVAVGVVVVAGIAGLVSYFFKRNKNNELEFNDISHYELEHHSDLNNLQNFKYSGANAYDKDYSTIDKIHIQNCTVSEKEVRELISGLIINSHLRLEKPLTQEIQNYTKSLPDNDIEKFSLLSNSSSYAGYVNNDDPNNINNIDMEEKKKGSVKSKNSVFSSISEYRKKNEKRSKKYQDLKKKLLDYEDKIRKEREENQKLKEELLLVKSMQSSELNNNNNNNSNNNNNNFNKLNEKCKLNEQSREYDLEKITSAFSYELNRNKDNSG